MIGHLSKSVSEGRSGETVGVDVGAAHAEGVSRFWEKLAAEHAQLLVDHGVGTVKRKQALRYFTWRWRPRAIARSEQLRFLLSHTPRGVWPAVLREPMELSDEAWAGSEFSPAERRLTVIATRIVWAYAERQGDPAILRLPEPEPGAPLPVGFRGRLISQDLANSSLECEAMSRALRGAEPRNILEIGGGYGRSAYALLSRYPRATYTIIDIEPARTISAWYLSELFGSGRVRFLSPDEAAGLEAGSIDLALSISSLHEMTWPQVGSYLEVVDRAVAPGGIVYLKQWTSWRNPDDDIELRFDAYPFPTRWRSVLYGPAPVQTHFTQGAWLLP